jgi:Spy/CpxP family protein refolding chaperone
MKRTNKILVTVLAGSLLLGGGAALAFGGHPGMGGCDRGGMMSSMRGMPQLDNLTDAQRSQLDTLRKEQRDAMRKQMDAMGDARDELRAAMDKGADTATIRKLADNQGAQIANMIVARAEMQQKLEAILTPEQREQLKSQRGQRFGGMGHPRHGW